MFVKMERFIVAAVLLLCALECSLIACTINGDPIADNWCIENETLIAVGDTLNFDGSDSFDDDNQNGVADDDPDEKAQIEEWEWWLWDWELSSYPYGMVGSGDTFSYDFDDPGWFDMDLYVKGDDGYDDWSSWSSWQVWVVGVRDVITTGSTENPVYVAVGDSIELNARKDPVRMLYWPDGWPKWYVKKEGDGDYTEISSKAGSGSITFSKSEAGKYIVKAECGMSSETIDVYVFDVVLSKCPENFLPKGGEEDNTVGIKMTIYPSSLSCKMQFNLFNVSSNPGYCLNKPSSLPQSGEDSDSWMDLQFESSQSGMDLSLPGIAVTTGLVNEKTVSVMSYDYGAYGDISGWAEINGTWYQAHEEGGSQYGTRIPRDDDENNIADCWGHNAGDATDDADTSLNNTYNGDGLTRYEEYRGVDIDGDGKVSSSERLNPNKKDLFVQGIGFGGDFTSFSYGSAFDEAGISVHDFVGSSSDCRGIDVLLVEATNTGGHIEQRSVSWFRDWTWASGGYSTVGTAVTYGVPVVEKKSHNFMFTDKPYKDGTTWTAVGKWDGEPNGELDPLHLVEDDNDNGVLDSNEKDGAASPPVDTGDNDFDGDYPVKDGSTWDWGKDLNPLDINNNGKVEMPSALSVSGITNEYTKERCVQSTVTHEMGHAVGIDGAYDGHCSNDTCEMYKEYISPDNDGHFCNTCRGQIRIHNN